MKRKVIKAIVIIVIAIIIIIGAFLINCGFVKRTNVVLGDYSVSEDGTELTFQAGVMSAIGYIRDYKDNGGGVKPHYLTFYSTFGGINSSWGAKNTFVLELAPQDTEIYFSRPDKGYELVLEKDEATGKWRKPYRKFSPESCGQTELVREEFKAENSEELRFCYEMEKFYVNDLFQNADKINNTLQKMYDDVEGTYREDAEIYMGLGEPLEEPINTPYDSLLFKKVAYGGDDYISLLFNDVSYMGGAHPYSYLEGVTIDCRTGEKVSASELLGKTDEEILQQVSKEMGMDVIATWEDIDYYITDTTIVFVYRMGPRYWEDVVWEWR